MAATKKTVNVRKKKRERLNVESGQAHIQASFNNTIVTITDMSGNAKKKRLDVKLKKKLRDSVY